MLYQSHRSDLNDTRYPDLVGQATLSSSFSLGQLLEHCSRMLMRRPLSRGNQQIEGLERVKRSLA